MLMFTYLNIIVLRIKANKILTVIMLQIDTISWLQCVLFIGAVYVLYVVRRCRYCDDLVTVCVCLWVVLLLAKAKPLIRMT